VRLVTVNLYNGRVVPRDLLRFLDEVQPDILCGQEVGPDAGRILERWFGHGLVRPSLWFEGRAMVARFPIEVASLPLAYRSGLRSAVALGDLSFDLLSVHLANPLDGRNGLVARRQQVDDLQAHLSKPGAVVLVGDLNATPRWPAYRRLRTCSLDDGVADYAAQRGFAPSRTWSKRPSWPAMLRIDHVLTRDVSVVGARSGRIAGLDHRPVIVDLARSNAEEDR
jgi:endonuclease/exonuclease/phosphatase family metal-dependent hydrolase